jgi:hypothetical protein
VHDPDEPVQTWHAVDAPVTGLTGSRRLSLRGWSYTLWALVLLSVVISTVIFALTHDTHTAAAYGFRFLLALGHQDSWGPMVTAIKQLRDDPDVPLYSKLFFTEQTKFQYPTSSLLFTDFLQRATGASWPTIIAVLNWLSWCCVWVTGVVSWRLFLEGYGGSAGEASPPACQKSFLLWPCLVLSVLFYPLAQSYVLGQIQTSITMLATLALLMWQCGRRITAGGLIGACCAIKPQWAILFLWAALRREYAAAAAGALTWAGLALAAGATYGFVHWIDYVPVLSYISQRGEGYYPNQSINGLINRLLFNSNNLIWNDKAFPNFNPIVYACTVAAAIILVGAALIFRIRENPGGLDFALMILSITMASPVAWEHHYGILLPIVSVLAPLAVSEKPLGRHTGAYLLIAFVVAGQRLDLTNRLADTRFNVLQSYLFFAAAMVLVLLFRCLARRRS